MRPATDEDRSRLKIPPGWSDVEVNDAPDADLLAVGRDAKGRRVSVYSSEHHRRQAAIKFARVRKLRERLLGIDRRIKHDRDGERSEEASALMLIRRAGLRPGSDRDTRADKAAFGASNLRARHVEIDGDTVRLRFGGKKGVDIALDLDDPDLAAMLRGRLRGKQPEDRVFGTTDGKLRDYLGDVAPGFKIKDFRTVVATTIAERAVSEMDAPTSRSAYRKQRAAVGDQVASALGNTRSMALNSYIDPAVFEAWELSLE